MFRLGARHIAEGTDHLLFLLALILPAPLVAAGGRWGGYAGGKTALRRIVKVVTAFTLGHSITLVFGALGWAPLPGAVVESAIALSILVSAVHALVPIFRGREVFIAGGFGLVHGLAFATTLIGFGFDPLTHGFERAGLQSRNRSRPAPDHPGGDALARAAGPLARLWAVPHRRGRTHRRRRPAWFAERAFGWVNPIVPLVENVASHALWLLAGLVVLTVAVTVVESEISPRKEILGKLLPPFLWGRVGNNISVSAGAASPTDPRVRAIFPDLEAESVTTSYMFTISIRNSRRGFLEPSPWRGCLHDSWRVRRRAALPKRTPRIQEGPFYPTKLPLDTDNDLLVINDGITPAVGDVTHLSGEILTSKVTRSGMRSSRSGRATATAPT